MIVNDIHNIIIDLSLKCERVCIDSPRSGVARATGYARCRYQCDFLNTWVGTLTDLQVAEAAAAQPAAPLEGSPPTACAHIAHVRSSLVATALEVFLRQLGSKEK